MLTPKSWYQQTAESSGNFGEQVAVDFVAQLVTIATI